MQIAESKLRGYGYLVMSTFFLLFFMMEMFFSSWKIDYLWPKVIGITIPFTLAMWEPTRLVILRLRKMHPGLAYSWVRMRNAMLVLVPYGCLIAVLRVFLENYYDVWGHKVGFAWYYTWTSGTVLLFILLQLAVYEGIFYFMEWKKAFSEAEELKRLQLVMQFDALKVQIQPHFLFNTLNTMIGLIEMDTARARRFTEELAYVYRYLLEASDRPLISLEEELNFAKAFFFLLKNRYDEGLYLEIEGEGYLHDYKIPPLSLQILLENAVKHNIISLNKPLLITIEIDANEHRVRVCNNLQRRRGAISTGKGLEHMREKFRLLGMPPMDIREESDCFRVMVPLVKSNLYESIDH